MTHSELDNSEDENPVTETNQEVTKTWRIKTPPNYYSEYLDAEGKPLTQEALAAKIATTLAQKDARIQELEQHWHNTKHKSKKKAKLGLDKAKRAREFFIWQEQQKLDKVINYLQKYAQS